MPDFRFTLTPAIPLYPPEMVHELVHRGALGGPAPRPDMPGAHGPGWPA
jgi:hypothetical protein